jgi:uncharacterized protein (DUF885 family)
MFKKVVLFVILISAIVVNAGEIDQLAQDYIDTRARFNPVWATSVGIYDYDSLLTNYMSEAIFYYRNDMAILRQKMAAIDTTRLSIDELIDYKLMFANLEYDEFFLTRFPFHARSAALYIEDITDGLNSLLMDKSRSIEEKAPFLLGRLKRIGDFTDQRWEYQYKFAPIFYETAIEMADGAIDLINETGKILLEVMPDSSRQISRYLQNAVRDIKSYKMYCQVEKGSTTGTHVIGKDNLNFLLKNVNFLDFDSDSLKKIGWRWYEIAESAMDSLQQVMKTKGQLSKPVIFQKDLTKQNILDYYQREINETADFFRNKDIVTIPRDIGPCIPMEMPEFMRAIRKGIAYQPPPPFSKDQTGYFYVRPIEDLDSAAIARYCAMIQQHGFRGSVTHEAYPGHHLQLSLANRIDDPLRKIQNNTMLIEGWALYCEQMATEQGLFDDDDLAKRWYGVWGGIRFRAVRIIVDCGLAEGSMTPDSALDFMNRALGENNEYYKAEIRRYCANPTQALSYLTGKLMILEMLKKARKKEGKSFSLKEFHNKILAEGSIPPALIAKKLGYK